MASLLNNRLAKRALRPAAALVDRRIQSRVERAAAPLRGELAALRREYEDERRARYAVELLLDGTGRGAHRMPPPAELDRLVGQVAALAGDGAAARRSVVAAYRTVVALEALGVGRLAGSTTNVCGKLATVPLLAPPNGRILEIGTLYGLFAAALTRMTHRAGIEPELTIVDPLAGSQLQPGTAQPADPTGTPVREDVVRANLALTGGGTTHHPRIVRGFSSAPEVRAEAGDRSYGVIVVDGDHSGPGVAADLEWVEEIAAPGGVVVLDDYGDAAWPGVQEALDAHLAGGASRLRLLGRVSTSAYLRAG
ncbi:MULTISPECIES: class I SAM-dependent methyltransferase [unclassified Streptomyces]|uniref:class I SAM-dependent methyltransferase n=1 Tax=unclassified Streptomyces TaxID=2593676 RepID=UPI000DAB683E|nr:MULTISPECIES: class I SAM-dependent methyltransferase [unclassified Streptomyces]PZT76246.1 class I SAM-dependent methyltransferase [Streptomyces sp. AC1-42W]PZT79801.1 class I SAM-dependent methyltransferase [Streptomyces sp. AC1-42T]